MKKLILLIFTVLLPMWINAQEYPTGITPYSFLKSWEYLISTPNNIDKAEAILLNAGYRKIGKFKTRIAYNLIYAKACNVKVSSNGYVESTSPNSEPGFSSFIEMGPEPYNWKCHLRLFHIKEQMRLSNCFRKMESTKIQPRSG